MRTRSGGPRMPAEQPQITELENLEEVKSMTDEQLEECLEHSIQDVFGKFYSVAIFAFNRRRQEYNTFFLQISPV